MDIQLFYLLSIIFAILLSVIVVLKVMPIFTKKPLTDEQISLLLEAQNYAKKIYIELKQQLGQTEEEQRNTMILLIKSKFPKLSENVCAIIVNIVLMTLESELGN